MAKPIFTSILSCLIALVITSDVFGQEDSTIQSRNRIVFEGTEAQFVSMKQATTGTDERPTFTGPEPVQVRLDIQTGAGQLARAVFEGPEPQFVTVTSNKK